jgi:hypothetical protein
MPAWLVPALKAVLPHVGTIITVAAPAFTRKSAEAANQAQLLNQQISELQQAATQNAENIKTLALQLQETLGALHQAAAIAETRLRRAFALCLVAIALSAITLGLAVFLILAR